MALTFKDARAAFQNAIPRRRDEFQDRIQERFRTICHEQHYADRYPVEVLRMAQQEIRERHVLAAQRVKQLLDSGWNPESIEAIHHAFVDMFAGFDHWKKDPSSDLYHVVEASFGQVGRSEPAKVIEHKRALGEAQVEAANEAISDLNMYAGKQLLEPVRSLPGKGALTAEDTHWQYDVFISHASEDKPTFVAPLANALRDHGLRVWFDAFTLTIGDSLHERIDEGLRSSRYGIVVLSHAFFGKGWPRLELDGLVARQTVDGRKVILPIWHGITRDEVAAYSPTLAGRLAANTSHGLETVVREITHAISGAAVDHGATVPQEPEPKLLRFEHFNRPITGEMAREERCRALLEAAPAPKSFKEQVLNFNYAVRQSIRSYHGDLNADSFVAPGISKVITPTLFAIRDRLEMFLKRDVRRHDSKFPVTIKRLRMLLDDFDRAAADLQENIPPM